MPRDHATAPQSAATTLAASVTIAKTSCTSVTRGTLAPPSNHGRAGYRSAERKQRAQLADPPHRGVRLGVPRDSRARGHGRSRADGSWRRSRPHSIDPRELIRRRGRSMIFIGRFIPGGRVAVTLASGSLGMSWRLFLGADVPAAGLWALYVTALGFLGGNAFEHSLWKPLLLAAAVAALVTAAGEVYRRLRLRHPAHRVSA